MKHRWGSRIVGITHIDAIKKQRVEMRIEAQVTGGALDNSQAAALCISKAALALRALSVPSGHGICEDAQNGAQQASVEAA